MLYICRNFFTMNLKIKAYQLHKEGKSYKEIATILNIGKTTAYDHVKEMKSGGLNYAPNTVPNGSELNPNVRSERKPERKVENITISLKNNDNANKISVPNVPNKKITKSFSGNDLLKMKFETLHFTGKFFEMIGNPEKHFSGIIWGLPKGGKSNLSIRFADYLQEYFGDVLYVAAEEGMSVSMQEKIRAINGSSVIFYPGKNRDEIKEFVKGSNVGFVFIDSINVANIDDAFLEEMKQENPNKSFVAIVQATKGGNFKGEQSLEHNCDFVIKVVNGIAYHKGRFGPESEIPIFEQSLYEKNDKKKVMPTTPTKEILYNLELKTIPDSISMPIPAKFQFPTPIFNSNIPLIQKPNFTAANNFTLQQTNNSNNLLGKVILIGGTFWVLKEIFSGGKN